MGAARVNLAQFFLGNDAGEDNHRTPMVERLADARDQLNTRHIPGQTVIGNNERGFGGLFLDQGERVLAARRRLDVIAFQFHQCLQRLEQGRVVFDKQDVRRLAAARSGAVPTHRHALERGALPERDLHGKHRAFSGGGTDIEDMPEKLRDAPNNGKAEPDTPTRPRRRLRDLGIPSENRLELVVGNAHARIPNLEPQIGAAMPASHDDFPRFRIFHGIGEEILDNPREQARIASNNGSSGDDAQLQTFDARVIGNLDGDPLDHILNWELAYPGLDGGAVQAIDVQQRIQRFGHDAEHHPDRFDGLERSLVHHAPGQNALKDIQRLQRLAQIVAHRRQKIGFRGVRPFGRLHRGAELVRGAFVLGNIGNRQEGHPLHRGSFRELVSPDSQNPSAEQRDVHLYLKGLGSGNRRPADRAQLRRVQSAAGKFMEEPADGLLLRHLEQRVKGSVGGDDFRIAIEDNQRLAEGIDDALDVGPGGLRLEFRLLQTGYVREGDDHAFDFVVLCPVRQNFAIVPCARVRLDFTRERRKLLENVADILEKQGILEAPREIRDRPPRIGRDHVEQLFRFRRKALYVEVGVEEERGNS